VTASPDYELSEEELAFRREVEAFLAANASPDVMDENPEQLSQTVDTPAKRAFMKKPSERGWLGISWPKEYGGHELSGARTATRWSTRPGRCLRDPEQHHCSQELTAAQGFLTGADWPRGAPAQPAEIRFAIRAVSYMFPALRERLRIRMQPLRPPPRRS
jgi:hypothetical protein